MKKKILIVVISLVAIIGVFLAVLTIVEYNPEDIETITTIGNANNEVVEIDEEYSITSFNIGYGGLGKTEDFFMDGGEDVRPDNKEMVENNIANIKDKIIELDSDFVIIQEVDEDSKRSYNINEIDELLLDDMEGSFAYNYKAMYVPFPFPTIGKVNSGILTMGKYQMESSERVSLPNPFSWPIRTVNLKRAIQITRYAIEDNENEFVLINFHLEAFDSGEGKTEQTKLLSEIILKEYEKGNFVIAGGDWNQTLIKDLELDPDLLTEWTPGTLDWNDLPDWEIGVDKNVPSNRSMLMPYVGNEETLAMFFIDGFIVSPNIEIVETKVQEMDYEYSDHEPVKMEFKLVE
ncbi:MAG: endonuclease/exonuclease/phosphatase family protein [Peptostreptococcaceae bacterium]|nr:endonuclease/exonuclease/phosphatase family protein [Peptostreptococcaceae bacterium]